MGVVVGNSFWFDFEVRLMEFLQRTLGETGVNIFSFFSTFGEEMMLILILGFLFWCYDKKAGTYVGINVMMGIVLTPLIKNVVWRRRPYFDHETIKCFRPVEKDADIYDIAAQGFSFPSGHSTNSAAVYGSLARFYKKPVFTVLAFVLPFLVGFSRVVVGCHYPTDVLCGWLTGTVIVFVMPAIISRVDEKKLWIAYLIIFLISAIGLFYCKTSDYFSGLGLMGGFFCSALFEKRFVNFETTRNPLFCVTRLLGGIIVYFALNTLFKMPFSKEFLDSGVFLANIVRFFRYAIVSFLTIGVYPFFFKAEGFLNKDK
ncbi:MAG: phosphatase PAP2 family protein [Butyrivibrio sp.]|uniref:phosphatase PAP2 family protein n=1 Tax=Butyrivibrio sp. TaxID=28121 RepID=UPI0025BD1791|nr:phosphatase PAP2 family protein [Butyrivibrio sp.]MBQ6588959.1 phosphatase PAP2 family protein [Butyrivibrio sp.]